MSGTEPASTGGLRAEQPEAAEPARPPKRRWLRRAAVILPLVLIAALLIAVAARVPLANRFGPGLVQTATGLDVTFSVTQLDPDALEIADLRLDGGPAARRLLIVPDWTDGPAIDRAEVDGLRGRVTLSPDGSVSVPGLDALLTETGNEDAAPPALPFRSLVLRDLAIDAETPLGPQRIEGGLSLTLPGGGALLPLTASVDLSAPDSDSAVLGDIALGGSDMSARFTLDASLAHWLPFLPGIATATGRISTDGHFSGAALDAEQISESGPAALLAAFSGTLETDWTGVTATGSDETDYRLSAGGVALKLAGGHVELHLDSAIDGEADRLPALLRSALPDGLDTYVKGPVQVALEPTDTGWTARLAPDVEEGWQTVFAVTARAASGPVSLTIRPDRLAIGAEGTPKTLRLTSADLDMIRGVELPRDIGAHLSVGPAELDLAALAGDASLPALDLPYRLEAAVYGDLAPPLWARTARVSAEGIAALRPELRGIDMTVNRGAQLRIEGLTGTGEVRVSPRLRLDVAGRDPMRIGFDFDDPIASLRVEGGFRLGALSLARPGAEPPLSVAFSRQPVSLRYAEEALAVVLGPVDVTADPVELTRAVLRADLDETNGTFNLTAEGMTMDRRAFLPGRLSATMAMSQDPSGIVRFEGPVSLAAERIDAQIDATLDRNGNSDPELRIETDLIRFGPEALSLEDVVPPDLIARLPAVPAVSGAIRATLDAVLTDRGPTGRMDVVPDALGFTTPGTSLSQIDGPLSFDLARLPATLGSQRMTARLTVRGLPPIPVTAGFVIRPDAVIAIEEANLGILGGGLALVETQIDPAAGALSGTIRLRRLDLAQALGLLDLQGVSGSGRLSGLIPLTVSAEDAVIDEGEIAADGNGALQVDNETLNQALATDEQSVQLLSDVLKDFRYDTLSAAIDLPRGSEGSVALRLGGYNPAVLDGHPFRINVTLDSDFRKLFGILRDVLSVSTAVLGRRRAE